jgi:hypothetical protein
MPQALSDLREAASSESWDHERCGGEILVKLLLGLSLKIWIYIYICTYIYMYGNHPKKMPNRFN